MEDYLDSLRRTKAFARGLNKIKAPAQNRSNNKIL
jgi:hypothetical protein